MNTTLTSREIAGLRVQRTYLAKRLEIATNAVAKAGMAEAIAQIDARLPAKPAALPADRNRAALKAHRTRLARQMQGASRKVQAALAAKIAEYDRKIAA